MKIALFGVAASVLFLSLVTHVAAAGFAGLFVVRTEVTEVWVCWNSAAERVYQLQRSSTLPGDDWADVGSSVTGSGGMACTGAPVTGSCAFYRVKELGGETNGAAVHATIEISEVRLCWATAANLVYQLQVRSALTSNVWTDAGPPTVATEAMTCEVLRVLDPRREYRLVGPEASWIPAGAFTMGSPPDEPARWSEEGPQTAVTLSRGFWLGKYEVTQGEYLEVMGSSPSWFQGADLPVEQVSWADAVAYCDALTAQELAAGRLSAGYAYRLPTEAEWEYACRAGTTTPFHYGSALGSGMANFEGYYEYPPCGGDYDYCYNPSGTSLGGTTTVGSYGPNGWGLYDMHGNVFEWCQDWFGAYSGGSVIDPQGPASGSYRVIRGGGWYDFAAYCRSANRGTFRPDAWNLYVGFRVVLAPGQSR